MTGNLSNRSSGVQITCDICTRLKRYLYSAKCSWIINYENLASQAEQAVIRGEQSELYRITRDLSRKFQGEHDDAVKDKDIKRITITDKQLQT